MNNIIPIIYLTIVCILLIPVSYFITVQILNFIYNTYTLKNLEKKNYYKNYSHTKYNKLLKMYIKNKLWALAINNLENALELQNIRSNKIIIDYINEIGLIYKQINYKKLSLEYYNLVSNLKKSNRDSRI
uniref:Ycf37 n=1 Tax=Batrachospermum sp. TaxID=31373 RepID=A0A8K1YV66_9FLOR|nr:hypothetical protein [Batrachospermum sp.]